MQVTMDSTPGFIRVALALICLASVFGREDGKERKCDPSDLTKLMCSANETCESRTDVWFCSCKPGYSRNKDGQNGCSLQMFSPTTLPANFVMNVLPDEAEVVNHGSLSTGAITAAVLVPLMLAVGALLVLVGRRYRWFERLQFLQNRNYEEVRIGQEGDDDDDPPLA